jgi:hypothetical protein
MVIDGIDADVIEEILETEISEMEKRHETNAGIIFFRRKVRADPGASWAQYSG